jgi:IS30 family transposase
MARRSDANPDLAQVSRQLEDLKRLAILQLLATGVQSSHIAKALGIHSSAISRMVPAREIKKLASGRPSS